MSKGPSTEARWGGWRRFSGVGKAVVPLAIGTVFLNLLGLVLPLSLLQVYDRIIPNSSTGTLSLLIGGVLLAVVLEVILRGARTAITGWLAARFEHNAGMAAFDRVLEAPVHEAERQGAGGLLERMSAIYSLKEHYADQGIAVMLDLPFVLLFLGLIWLLGGDLVWVPATVLVLFSAVMLWHGRQLRRAIRNYNEVRDRRLSFNIEILSGIHAVKALAMEGQMTQRYVRLQEAVARADHDVVLRNASAQTLSNMFSQMVMVASVALGSVFVINNMMTVGALAACTLLAGRAVQPVQRAVGMWTRMQTVSLARERAGGLFALPARQRPAAPHVGPMIGHLELENVSFSYGKDAPALFEAASLEIEPGECVGITGTNGCGKSSLLRLMSGTLSPTAGEVRIDGVPLAGWAPEALEQAGVGLLPSEAFLFRGTLLDNLTMFRRELRDRALQAASDLGLDEVVSAFPNGYLTTIAGGAADAMPRGIRQRIAIARVLALDPRIILFDEANTAMDGPGDEALRAHLESLKGDRTLVLVSLRPSLLKLADRRFEIVGGRLDPREDPSLTGRFGGAGAASVRRSTAAQGGAVAQ